MKVLENIQAVRSIGKFQNYLITIAVNLCNNDFKKAKPTYTDLEALELTDDKDSSFERIIQDL